MGLYKIHSIAVLLLVLLLVSSGCSTIGPERVPGDQFDYNSAIAEAESEQLLMNLVRMRYSETPTFLTVSSVISQYSRALSASANAGLNTAVAGEDSAGVGGGVVWTDQPTITYVPVTGQKFSEKLLTPLPPTGLFGMLQSGWPAEIVFRMSIWSMNDLRNDVARPSLRRQGNPGLWELTDILERLRQAGALGIRDSTRTNVPETITLFLRSDLPPELRADADRFRQLLGLSTDLNEFRLSYGLLPVEPVEVAILTGSIWDIMLNLSWQFEVPPEHVASGRTAESFQSQRHDGVPPIEVLFSADEPEDAFVKVFTQDHWFYLSQDDRFSKRAFSFLQLLLTLAQTSVPDRSPALTISN